VPHHLSDFCQLLAVTLDDPKHFPQVLQITAFGDACEMHGNPWLLLGYPLADGQIAQLTKFTYVVSLDEAGRSEKAKVLKYTQQSRLALETRSFRSLA